MHPNPPPHPSGERCIDARLDDDGFGPDAGSRQIEAAVPTAAR